MNETTIGILSSFNNILDGAEGLLSVILSIGLVLICLINYGVVFIGLGIGICSSLPLENKLLRNILSILIVIPFILLTFFITLLYIYLRNLPNLNGFLWLIIFFVMPIGPIGIFFVGGNIILALSQIRIINNTFYRLKQLIRELQWKYNAMKRKKEEQKQKQHQKTPF